MIGFLYSSVMAVSQDFLCFHLYWMLHYRGPKMNSYYADHIKPL